MPKRNKAVISLALFASAVPSPLYPEYAARWHFSTPVLTGIYAMYAFGALAALLALGRLSDDVGRRPVLASGLIGVLVSMLLFAIARSVEWLLIARLVQGVATGAILTGGGAALLDLEPRQDPGRSGLVNGVGAALGIGTGALVSSLLAEDVARPLVTPFALVIVLLLAALGGVGLLAKPAARPTPRGLRPQRPRVPPEIRGAFALAGAGAVASWSIAGLYLALAPALAVKLLHTHSHVAGGVAVFALGGAAGLAQIPLRLLTARRAIEVGSLSLAIGMLIIIASISASSAVLFLIATAITGAGWGVAFMGAIRSVAAAAPVRERAGVIAASKLLLPMQRRSRNHLREMLSEDVVYHSPVRDYRGQADVTHILLMIGTVLDAIDARREIVAEREIVTIITATHLGKRMDGVLEEGYDQLGRVEHATLLLRPLSALCEAIGGMRMALQSSPLPDGAD